MIFCPVSITYSTQIVKLVASLGIEIPILGGDTLDSNMVLEAAAGADVRLYVSTFYQEGGSPEFDEGFKAWLSEDSTAMTNNGGNDTIAAVTAMGYDAYYVALEALKAAGSTDKAAVKAAAPDVTYTGVSGSIAFDEQGDAIRGHRLYQDRRHRQQRLDAGDGPDCGISPAIRPAWRYPRQAACSARDGTASKGAAPGLLETVLPLANSERKGGIPVQYGISILLSRHLAGRAVRPDRHRIHHGLQHPAPDQLRPRRRCSWRRD